MLIKFPEWLPDLQPFESGGTFDIVNVVPLRNTYRKFADLTVASTALDARCQGATSGVDFDGNVMNVAGDINKLYELVDTSWTDISSASGYTTQPDENWFFTQWKEQIIATNFDNPVQTFTVGSSTIFTALAGSPPNARYVTQVRDFLVLGSTENSPQRVRWCGFNDETTWAVSSATQADFQDLPGRNGFVTQVVGGAWGTIFQETAITVMTYVGSPAVFQFDEIERNVGTQVPGSVVRFGTLIAYYGTNGFQIFDGKKSTPIGHNQIDLTFQADLDTSHLHRVFSVACPDQQIIYWIYPGVGNTGGRPNKILMYNYSSNTTKRWTQAEIDTECIYKEAAQGYTLDGLDAVSSSIDALPFSLDSRAWTGGQLSLAAFDADNKSGQFTGSALPVTLTTSELQITPDRKTRLRQFRPLVTGTNTTTLQVGRRNRQDEDVSFTAASTVNASGITNNRSNARYHRLKLNITGDFTSIEGINVINPVAGGRR